jgi:LPS sulfotransferase NodH
MTGFKSYLICGTPRSGSTMLCGLLESAGCGRADSYFGRPWIPDFARDLGVALDGDIDSPDFNARYFRAVLSEGRAGGEVFGLRVMFETLDELATRLDALFSGFERIPDRLAHAFGRPLYIHLSRRDKVAQAISLLTARQTGLWHRASDGSELERTAPHRDPVYDGAAIGEQVAQLEAQDGAWGAWFAAQGIEPLRLTYEDLARDPQAGLRMVLAALGADATQVEDIKPRTARLADERAAAWAEQFRAENARFLAGK